MRLLGIDYGEKFVGLSFTEGNLISPLVQINTNEAIFRILKYCDEYDIEACVLGIPQGRIVAKVKEFAKLLGKSFSGKIILWDETLTSFDAREILKETGKFGKNRSRNEHKIASAILLKSYLDQQKLKNYDEVK